MVEGIVAKKIICIMLEVGADQQKILHYWTKYAFMVYQFSS